MSWCLLQDPGNPCLPRLGCLWWRREQYLTGHGASWLCILPLPHPGHCSCTKWRTDNTSHFESSSWRQVILPQTVLCQNTENSCYSHTLEPPAHFKTLQGEDLAHKFFSCKSCYFWSSCCVKETNPWFTQFARNRKKRDNTNTDKSNREKNSQEENCLTLIYNVSCVCVSVCLISAKCSWGS